MPGDYSCILCSKSIYFSGKKKHLFNKRHLSEIHSGILKARGTIERWIAEYDQGKKSHLRDCFPPISLRLGKSYTVCIPCKHLGEMIKGHKTCTQEAMKQNVEYYRDILKQTIQKETRVSIETQTDGSGGGLGVVLDTKEIDKLKKEITQLKDELFEADGKNEKTEQILDAWKYSLEYVKREDTDIFRAIISGLEEEGYDSLMVYLKKLTNN
jgi:hypothetical protein